MEELRLLRLDDSEKDNSGISSSGVVRSMVISFCRSWNNVDVLEFTEWLLGLLRFSKFPSGTLISWCMTVFGISLVVLSVIFSAWTSSFLCLFVGNGRLDSLKPILGTDGGLSGSKSSPHLFSELGLSPWLILNGCREIGRICLWGEGWQIEPTVLTSPTFSSSFLPSLFGFNWHCLPKLAI